MWKGRFQKETTNRAQRFGESVSFDWKLARFDILGSIAHARALFKAGILERAEFDAIQSGLEEIGKEIEEGTFEFRVDLEDVHMNIESALTERIGTTGAKLHTARSRNDQVALDTRLYALDAVALLSRGIRNLQKALVEFGQREKDKILPGYTHLQRAQPVFFAHHLLAYVEMLERDATRFLDSRDRIDVMPLGSGALAGSTINLDRRAIADELGFSRLSQNSMDAVCDRDFVVELVFCCALTGTHLSRLSEDLILWSSAEFGFVELSDAHTTGSSLMPQKKNPDMAELTRGKTGRLNGNLVSLLTTLKGLPMTYNRDLQEDKEPFFDSIETLSAALEIFAEMLNAARANGDAMRNAAADSFLLATDIAEYLVENGVAFRHAHEITGKLTAHAVTSGRAFETMSLDELREFSDAFDASVTALFSPHASLAKRTNPGSPCPDNVAAQLDRWENLLCQER